MVEVGNVKLNEATMNDLDKHLAELINDRLAKPIYLRVTQGDDGLALNKLLSCAFRTCLR